ncbi:hypothetical protein [Rhizobium paknamense]|uniref:Uncharacterized protein n=1 Tax=Rhizobium paknamense TaxID=1206817 RepID=A0ABU0IG46_9HYPH|nr:hypothetical protein [Rhizobium paknamense]MDQ0456395.1 hypothetical protein [Rhizobium paknamense]
MEGTTVPDAAETADVILPGRGLTKAEGMDLNSPNEVERGSTVIF